MLTGLGLAAVGGLRFIPASELLVYEFFLLVLFVLAAGMSILETSANPFVIAGARGEPPIPPGPSAVLR